MSISYRVEIAFASTPLATNPIWTDVTSYWVWDRGFTLNRGGRPDEFSRPQPGTINGLYLDNSSGAFTYGNPASPFAGNVLRDKQIRIVAVLGGVDYVRWTGHVDDFKQTYINGVTSFSVVEVPATSRMRMISNRGALRSFLGEEVLYDRPTLYVPLSDDSVATMAQNVASNPTGNASIKNVGGSGAYSFGTGTGPPQDGSSALVLTPLTTTNGYYLEVPMPYYVTGSPYGVSLEAWVNTVAGSTIAATVLYGSKASALTLGFDSGKHLVGTADQGTLTATSASVIGNGATRHIVATLTASGTQHTLRTYVDGVLSNTTTLANTSTTFQADRIHIGGDGFGQLFSGTISHVAFHPTALSVTRIAAHYAAGWTGFGGESSDARVARIATYVGLASTTSSSRTGVGIFDDPVLGLFDTTAIFAGSDSSLLESGSAVVYGQNTGGQNADTMLQDVADTENGLVVMTRDGLLTMQARSHRYNKAPRFAISAADVEQDLTWSQDVPYQANVFTAVTQDGVAQTARNQTSIDANTGVAIADRVQLLTRDANDAYAKASWTVNRYGAVGLRSPQISIDLGTLEDGVAAQVLPADLGDSFLLTDTAASWAPQNSAGYFIEDYSERVSPGRHLITFSTSDAALSRVGVFDDSRYGQFDTTMVFAF